MELRTSEDDICARPSLWVRKVSILVTKRWSCVSPACVTKPNPPTEDKQEPPLPARNTHRERQAKRPQQTNPRIPRKTPSDL